MTSTQTPLDAFIEKAQFEHVRPCGQGFSARCPAHEDQQNSLSISSGDDGRVLVHCHAGCTLEAVLQARGLSMADISGRSGLTLSEYAAVKRLDVALLQT